MNICRTCLRSRALAGGSLARTSGSALPRPRLREITIPRRGHEIRLQSRSYSSPNNTQPIGGQKRSIFSFQTWKETARNNPVTTFLGLIFISSAIVLIGYPIYQYYDRVMRKLSRYPKKVEEHIRRGLYHKIKEDYPNAIREFQNALRQVNALDMDPTSDEVTGLKIMFAGVFAEAKMETEGIVVLENTRDELIMSLNERRIELGEKRRAEVMQKCVGIGRVLSKMYLDIDQRDQAEEALIWAIDTAKKEKELQDALWPDSLIGILFEQLADFYQVTKRPAMATPLYLEALTHIHPPICHSAVLMNNVGTSMLQTPIPQHASISPAEQQEAAKKWHEKAIEISTKIKSPERTPECDEACIVSLLNLGQLEQRLGNSGEARKRFLDAENLSRTRGLSEWMEMAESLLKELDESQTG